MDPIVALVQKDTVQHYRVSIYNYLSDLFAGYGMQLVVLADSIEGSNPHRIHFGWLQSGLRTTELIRQLEILKASVVICHLSLKHYVIWPLLLYGIVRRVPILTWRHAIDLAKPNHFMKNWLYAAIDALSAGIVLYTDGEKRYVSKRSLGKVYIANNTLNFRDFPEITETKAQLRKKWGVHLGRVVLFVGRIQDRKRIHHLIEAFEVPEFSEYALIIVGPGLSPTLASRIEHRTNISYLGPMHEPRQINELFKLSDVFCIPGSAGLGINQAFYWGLPIVTEHARHGPEIGYLSNGQNGFIVGDKLELRLRLLQLLRNDDLREAFSESARRTISEQGDIDLMARGFLEAVQAAISSRRGRSDQKSRSRGV